MSGILAPVARVALAPMHAAAVLSSQKSFRANPVLASPRLNRLGLHKKRVEIADALSRRRRRRLRRLVDDAHAEAIDRDGFTIVRNALPPETFEALRREVEDAPLPAHENRSGDTVSRFIDLPPAVLRDRPALRGFVRGRLFQGLLRYTASFDHAPLVNVNATIVEPDGGPRDANTSFHSDTFHATAKAWFFIRDVELADGPFMFVRGSHRLTPERLEWEFEKSLVAGGHPDPLTQIGSFRTDKAEMAAMGFDEIEVFDVPANTLVVADTHGFHARRPADRPSIRMAVYGSLRASPFNPLVGPDALALVGLGGRKGQIGNLLRRAEQAITGKPDYQPYVGDLRPGDPTTR
ncbi:MAG: phytanoyl-CoA dioxygenase family protein [Pseudomonadota bacterium]